MKRKQLLLAVALLSMVATSATISGCKKENTTENGGSEGGGSESGGNGGENEGGGTTPITNPMNLLKEALKKDYSNSTVESYQVVNEETQDYDISYLLDGYDLVYTPSIAEAGGSYEDAFMHYYVTKENDHFESYLYFETDTSIENSKGGWLQKGYKNADLSIWNTYAYLPLILSKVTADDFGYQNGVYFIKSATKVEELNYSSFGYAWFNDVIDIALTLNPETGEIEHIFGFCDEDPNETKNFVQLNISSVGSTTVPSSITLHDAPNETNTTTYWQYKGWPHDYEKAYYQDIHAKISSNQEVESNETYDAILDLDDRLEVEVSLTPETFMPYDLVDEENLKVTWHYDENIVELESASKSNHRLIHAIGSGETEIYATVEGEHGTLTSEKIKISVKERETIDKTDAVYDFTFLGIDKENSKVLTQNNTTSKALFEVTSGPATSFIDGKNSDIFEQGKSYLVVDPGSNEVLNKNKSAGLYFNFGEQQVSSLAFSYGLFYASHITNVSNLKEVKITTYNDETVSEVIDITNEIKTNLSEDFTKICKLEFAPANRIEITFKSSTIGKSVGIGLDEFVFKANDECHDYIAPEDKINVESVNLLTTASSLYVGETAQLSTVIAPLNATNKEVTYHISSESEGIISVSPTGLITALSEGEATVYATSVDGNIKSNEVTITVSNAPTIPLEGYGEYDEEYDTFSINLTNDKAIFTVTSYTAPYTFEATYKTFKDTSEGTEFVFENENKETFTISFDIARGKIVVSNIKYLKNGALYVPLKSSFNFTKRVYPATINVKKVGSLTKNENNEYTTLKGNTSYIYKSDITFTPSNVNQKDIEVVSLNSDVVTVTEDESYYVLNFVGSGKGEIKVYSSSNESVFTIIKFDIAPLIYPTEENFVISSLENKTTIEQGEKLQFSASFLNESEITSSKNVTWSVQNGSDVTFDGNIASISSTGLLTASTATDAIGTVIVTATVKGENGNISKSMTITITPASTTDVIPVSSGLIGTWSGEDDSPNSLSVTVNSDGTMILSVNDTDTFNFVYNPNTSFEFTCIDEGYENVIIELYINGGVVQLSFIDENYGQPLNYDKVWIYEYIELTK